MWEGQGSGGASGAAAVREPGAGGKAPGPPPQAARRVPRSARASAAVEPGNRAQLRPRAGRALRFERQRAAGEARASALAPRSVGAARPGNLRPDHRVQAFGLARLLQLADQAPRLFAQPLRRPARPEKPQGAPEGALARPDGAAAGNPGGGSGAIARPGHVRVVLLLGTAAGPAGEARCSG